jgi:GNAT superfamily N-acetyltransferase
MKIRPMDKDFILFRCLHNGPLSTSNIETKGMNIASVPSEQLDKNKKFLTRLVEAYGSCAMLALEDDYVVAHARFYPQAIYEQYKFCCHDPSYAITQEIAEMELPQLTNEAERILRITCFFVLKDYRGQELSHKLIDAILKWAKNNNWKSVRCFAYQDNYWLASEMCTPMLRTYSKHGFKKIGIVALPEVKDFLQQIKNGELGIEKKKEFEKFCSDKDLSELVDLYEVECQL